MAPTLSVLLGHPIPASSIGSLIPGLLTPLTNSQRLYVLYYNTQRLIDKLTEAHGVDSLKDREFFLQFDEAKRAHKECLRTPEENVAEFKRANLLYESVSVEASAQLQRIFNKFDEFSIWFGAFYVLAVRNAFFISFDVMRDQYITHFLQTLLTFLCTSASSAMVVRQLLPGSVLLLSVAVAASHRILCQFIDTELPLCYSTNNHLAYTVPILVILGITTNARLLLVTVPPTNLNKIVKSVSESPPFVGFLLFGVILHAVSLASSSFIEEEHQTWYYLTATLLLLLYAFDFRRMIREEPHIPKPVRAGKTKNAEPPTLINFLTGKNAADRFVWYHSTWLHLLALHLLARRLNQTGDKWLSLPDIGDWLVMDEHRLALSFFMVASLLLMIVNCADYGSILTNVLTLTASVLVYYYRTLTGAVHFAGIKASE